MLTSSTCFHSWGRGVPDHARYYAGTDVVEYQIGQGVMPNHHCILESLDYGMEIFLFVRVFALLGHDIGRRLLMPFSCYSLPPSSL